MKIGFIGLLTLALIVLKLSGIIAISWLGIFGIWFGAVIAAIVLYLLFFVLYVRLMTGTWIWKI